MNATDHHQLGRRPVLLSLPAMGALSLTATGCSSLFGDSGTDDTAGQGNSSITVQVNNAADLDPQAISDGMWLSQKGLLEGLVLQNIDGTDVEPAVAESWDVSDDGTVHTFHLRDDAAWSDGEAVTADHFATTYERLLDPERGNGGVTLGANSYQVTLGIAGAEDFMAGNTTDFEEVGVKAVDDSTLEITLTSPNPGFLMGLTHPSMLPLRTDEEDTWQKPESWLGNGPYNVAAWTLNSSMTLTKNPEYWNADNVSIETVNIQLMEPGSIASTVPYENDEVDIQGLSNPSDVTRFQDDPELKDELSVLENVTTTYLARLHSKNTLLEDPAIRSALSLGLGREEIAGISPIANPASTLISSALEGWTEDLQAHPQLWGADAVTKAQELLEEAGYPNGEGFPKLTLLAGSEMPELDAIIDTWKSNLGIEVSKDVVETGVYVEKRAELHDDDYLGYYYGSFSGALTWPYHVQQLWDSIIMGEHGLPADAYQKYLELKDDGDSKAAAELRHDETDPKCREYADTVAEVRETADEAEQLELLRAAAKAREEAEIYIPLTWTSAVFAVKPWVEGFTPRAQADRYYFKDLSTTEKE
jgi:peptide/nickel transport system substrate-binding protein/oligopeptide transport system substrate-binding protein